MNGIGISEEVVHITENLLICPDKENTYIIMFAMLDRMQRQVACLLTAIYISSHLTIRVAGDILNLCRACWLLVKSLNRHDREELVYAP